MVNDEKIVIFDWGGIVESHFEGEYNCHTAQIDVVNLLRKDQETLNPDYILEKWEECAYNENGKSIVEYSDFEETKKWFERFKLKFNLKCDYDEFYKAYQDESEKIKYYKEVVEFAHSLKDKCKIGILSNLAWADKTRIDKHYDLSKFDYVWLSFELNCKKPDERIYEIVEKDCQLPTNKILFIDDSPANIKVAQKRGWNTCLTTALAFDKMKESVNNFLQDN